MKYNKILLASALIACQPSLALAQTSNSVETISITGARSPIAKPFIAGSASVIDSELIMASGALTLTDLLRTIAGVNVSQSGPTGSLTELRFRGGESNHVMVLVDGVEINDLGQGGLVDFSHIVLSQIERVEILRGPQSAVWGSNAISGVINITTKQAGSSGVSPSLQASIGDKGTYQASASVGGMQEHLSYGLNASVYNTDGENISRSGVEDDSYENTSLSAKLALRINDNHRLNTHARYLDYASDFDATDFSTGLISDADNSSLGEQISIGLDWHFNAHNVNGYTKEKANAEGVQYSNLVTIQYAQQETLNYSAGSFSGSTLGEKLRVLWNNRFNLEPNTFVNVGLEAVQEDYEQAGPIVFGDPNQKQSNDTYSIVSSTQWSLNEATTLNASLRFDNNSEFDNTDSYRAGAVYRFSNSLRGFASLGKAIKNPTFTERFGFFPQTFLGNPNLQPETQRSLEAGLEGSYSVGKHNFNTQVTVFKAKLNNEILGFVFDADSGQFTAQNASGNSERNGVEISADGQYDALSWQAQYTYLDASEAAFDMSGTANSTELRRARHTGSGNIRYNFEQGTRIYLQADYTGSRLDRFFPPFPAPSQIVGLRTYWLVSANVSHEFSDSLSINLRLNNALDHEYEDVIGFSTESRRVLLSLAYKWR